MLDLATCTGEVVLSCDIRSIDIPQGFSAEGHFAFGVTQSTTNKHSADWQLAGRGDARAQLKRRRRTLRHSAWRQEGLKRCLRHVWMNGRSESERSVPGSWPDDGSVLTCAASAISPVTSSPVFPFTSRVASEYQRVKWLFLRQSPPYTERFGTAIKENMETLHTSHESGKSNISSCYLCFVGRKRGAPRTCLSS